MNLRALFLVLPFLHACATAVGSFAPLDANHPASPEAPELPIADPSAFLHMDAGEAGPIDPSSPSPAGSMTAPPAGAFVCPMHVEVSSDSPGSCPKCGMALVPRASTAPAGKEPPHDH